MKDMPHSDSSSRRHSESAPEFRPMGLVFVVSFALLFVEMIQPKVFQYVKFYGPELAVVAVAMLGLAVGGIVCYAFGRYSRKWTLIFSLLLPLSAIASFLVSAMIHNYIMVVFFAALFYFAAGVILGLHFIGFASHRIYFSNLVGSGLGVLAVYLLLPALGNESCMFLAAVIASAGAVAFAARGRRELVYGALIFALCLFMLVFHIVTGFFDLARIVPPQTFKLPQKEMIGSEALKNPRNSLLATGWSMIARIDVIETPGYTMGDIFLPSGQGSIENPEYRREFVESSASTTHLYWNNNVFGSLSPAGSVYSIAPPYMFLKNPRVLVVGVGGGLDLAKAAYLKPKRLVGVEINSTTVRLMKGPLADRSHNVYNKADIKVMDARTYVHYTAERFDLINLVFASLWIPFYNSNIFMENYLYTVEAFRDYYRALSDDGYLSITKWVGNLSAPSEMMRVTGTMLETLSREGVADPSAHVAVIGFNAEGWKTYGAVVIMKKSPYTAGEVEAIRNFVEPPFFTLYLPDGESRDNPFSNLVHSADRKRFYTDFPVDVAPTTDDRPFFHLFDKSLHFHKKMLKYFGLAVAILCVLPLGAVFFIRGDYRMGGHWTGGLYFSLIGAGFMFLETTLVQKLNLPLGGALYSLTLVIFCLLVFAGLGSWAGGRFGERAGRWTLLLPPLMLLLYFPAALKLVDLAVRTWGTGLWLRLGVSGAALAPLCFVLGFPFPWGLRRVKELCSERSAGLMYAVNSAVGVAAIVVGLYLSARHGLEMLYRVSALCYAAVFALSFLLPAGRKEP